MGGGQIRFPGIASGFINIHGTGGSRGGFRIGIIPVSGCGGFDPLHLPDGPALVNCHGGREGIGCTGRFVGIICPQEMKLTMVDLVNLEVDRGITVGSHD